MLGTALLLCDSITPTTMIHNVEGKTPATENGGVRLDARQGGQIVREHIVQVDADGRIVLPFNLRELMEIAIGDQVEIAFDNEERSGSKDDSTLA